MYSSSLPASGSVLTGRGSDFYNTSTLHSQSSLQCTILCQPKHGNHVLCRYVLPAHTDLHGDMRQNYVRTTWAKSLWECLVRRGWRMQSCKRLVLWLAIVMCVWLWTAPWVLAEEKPQRGGVLRVAHAADPPSLDTHQEQTFAVNIPMAPVYNTLVMF